MNDRQGGSITLPIVILTPALLLVAGLVIDGGNALTARQRAANEAESAARAGAAEVSIDAIRRGDFTIDQAAAERAALAFVAATGDVAGAGDVTTTARTVTVTVHATSTSYLLGVIGLSTFRVEGTATAESQRGVTRSEP